MKIGVEEINNIKNLDKLVDNSHNGTCFAYSWFLELNESTKVICIRDNKDSIMCLMPLFLNNDGKKICQSTMYIPYGGPVLFNVPKTERNKIRYIRKIENALSIYLKENYDEISFSTDNAIIDIMPFIRNDFVPEIRYTYKLDLKNELLSILDKFGSDRQKEIKLATKEKVEFFLDNDMKFISPEKCMEWEKKYNFPSSVNYVRKYMLTTIKKDRGMCFVAKKENIVYGSVHVAWDAHTAYILYSYFEKKYDVGAITFLYYKIFEYLKNIKKIEYIDFEGSVYESVENFNISFGAYQSIYFNLTYSKMDLDKIYHNLYKYYEK